MSIPYQNDKIFLCVKTQEVINVKVKYKQIWGV